jgi:hypothetical protein
MNDCYVLPHVNSSNLYFRETEKQLQTSYNNDAAEVLIAIAMRSTSGM